MSNIDVYVDILENKTYEDEICATILKSLDKNIVNFKDEFIYTIDVSFSGIEGDINSAKVEDVIPDYIEYTLPKIEGLIQDITEESVPGGTLITFDFGSIDDLGVVINLNIRCKFKIGTDNNTSFTNEASLYINDVLDDSIQGEEVTLFVEHDFILEKDVIAPANKVAAQGGRVIYVFTLRNKLKENGGNGDEGAKINNIVITDVMPDNLVLSQDFLPVGYDESGNYTSDRRYDNRVGSIDLVTNTVTFDLPDYYGTKYTIILVAYMKEDTTIGTEITNTTNWEIDSVLQSSASDTVSIGEENYGAYITKGCPRYSDVGDYIRSDINIGNYGNMDLVGLIIEQDIPDEYKVLRINTGSYWIGVLRRNISLPYDISYQINNNEFFTLGTYTMDNDVYVDMPTLNEDEKITMLRWNLANLPVGGEQNKNIYIDYEILDNNQDNINDIARVIWDDGQEQNTVIGICNTNISDLSELRLTKQIIGSQNVYTGDTIKYRLTINANNSPITNPVISDLLSNKLEYIGEEYYRYYDYFDQTVIDSNDPDFFDKIDISKEVIDNFNNTGQKLIRYTLNNFKIRHKGNFYVEFLGKVKVGESGQISNDATLGTIGDRAIVPNNQISYLDVDDRDGDLITDENILITSAVNSNILTSVFLASDKKVKGELDLEYTEEPNVGKTYAGGDVEYKIEIKNIGNVEFQNIEIVDILPYIGDTGVILTNENRQSEFVIYNIRLINAVILDENSNAINTAIGIEYSKSYDPVRFSKNNFGNDMIGTIDDWNKTEPDLITDVKSVKIYTINETKLRPNEILVVYIKCKAPLGVEPSLVAWNSFAIKASYLDDNQELKNLIPVEPEKVGVEVIETNKGRIGSFVWKDKNENGYYEDEEVGLNSIEVELYSQEFELLNTTKTTNDSDGNPGYYVFDNLDNGNYYIKFKKPNNLFYTIQKLDGGSIADIYSGISPIIEINDIQNINDNINAGFVEDLDIIDVLLEILHKDIYNISCDTLEGTISSINEIIITLSYYINIMIKHYEEYINSNETIDDLGYKAQLERLIYVLKYINSRILYMSLPKDYCNINILANILYILLNLVLNLIIIEEDNRGLIKYYNEECCIIKVSFSILIGKFINDITILEHTISDINKIIGILFSQFNKSNRPYNPVYIPK